MSGRLKMLCSKVVNKLFESRAEDKPGASTKFPPAADLLMKSTVISTEQH